MPGRPTHPSPPSADEQKIGLGVDEQPADEIVNDSLGTIDSADTADTGTANTEADDPTLSGKGSRRKQNAA